MALIKCSECKREVSDRADACPHCGCPVSQVSQERPRAAGPQERKEAEPARAAGNPHATSQAARPGSRQVPPPLPSPSRTARHTTPQSRWGMGWLLVIGVAILLAITNPAKETHAEAIMRHGAEKGLIEGIAAAVVVELADYHNYVVFSTAAYNEQTLTFGILGNVWWVVADD